MQPSHSHDTTLTIFLGRGRLAHGIRQTLEDFTATGLVRDLVWVDADTFASSSSPVTYLRLDDEGNPRISRESFNVLIARSGADRLHLGVVNVVGPDDSFLGSTQLSPLLAAIDSVSTGLSVHRTNLLISAVGAPYQGDLPLLRGYTNLLLAPEDSPGPDAATVPFHFDRLDNRFTLHCVAGLASLFGLWEGSATAPVTRLEPANGLSFRLVRAFYRRIDGQEVQARLKTRILDTTDNPLPLLERPGQNIGVRHPENPEAFAEGAARELLDTFSQRLEGRQAIAVSEKTRQTSSRSALGEFLSTWWKKFVTTPQRFWAGLRAESGSFLDDTVQSTIYGANSRTHVGTSLSLPGESTTAEEAGHPDHGARAAAELGPLWAAYANTAMTLLDASARPITETAGESTRPQAVSGSGDGQIQVAHRAADVIPGPTSHFGGDLPVEVKVAIDGGEIAPYDVLGVADYERTLSDQRHGTHRDIGRVIGDFKQWQQHNSTSFAYFVGRGLLDKKEQLRQRQSDLREEIDRLNNQQVDREGSGIAGRVFRWLGWVTFWSMAAFAGLWLVGTLRTDDLDLPLWQWVRNLNDAPASTLAWTFGLWTGLWLIFWISQVFFEARDEIRFLHRRRDIVSRLQAAEENLQTAAEALLRLDIGYRQFLSTSQMMGALLEQPFGRVRQPKVESTIPVNTMPDSVVFAEAAPAESVVDLLATSFRRELYREGWLNTYVMGSLNSAAADFNQRSNEQINLDTVFSTAGRGTGGQLARLADWVTGEEFSARDRSSGKWRQITDLLRTGHHRDDTELLSSLQVYRAGQRHTASSRAPLAETVTVGSFNGEVTTERGRVHGILDPDPDYCSHDRSVNTFDAIGVSEVLVQVGESADQADVVLGGVEKQRVSDEVFSNMPVSEDARPQHTPVTSTQQPRYQLPGMGEF